MNATIDTAMTGDDLLTALAGIKPEYRHLTLGCCGLRILREAADLCGEDSADMGKRAAITAILDNF